MLGGPPLPPDPYLALGVDRKAQLPEIRSAYKKLVLSCHPDKVALNEDEKVKEEKLAMFQRVQQAYELLNDEKERTKYDDLYELSLRGESVHRSNISVPRAHASYNVNLRNMEPRSASFTEIPIRPARINPFGKAHADNYVYVDKVPLHTERRGSRRDSRDEELEERARRKREKERERDEKERARDRREKERDRREQEEEERRAERKRIAKEAKEETRRLEKKRQEERDRKHRHKSPGVARIVVEEIDDEPPIPIPSLKKRSSASSRKHEDRYEEVRKEKSPDRLDEKMSDAMSHIQDRKLGAMDRHKFDSVPVAMYGSPPAVPTPPIAKNGPFQPPPPRNFHSTTVESGDDSEDDQPHRSRATPRRGSYGISGSKDRLGHKKSYSSGRDEPHHYSASPPTAAFVVNPPVPDSPPRGSHLPRSFTFEPDRPPMSGGHPPMRRAETYAEGAGRGRARSRYVPQVDDLPLPEELDELDERRRERRHKSSRSRKARSPDYAHVPPRRGSKMGHEKVYHETRYYPAAEHDGGTRVVPVERSSSYTSSSGYGRPKTARQYAMADVNFSSYQPQAPFGQPIHVAGYDY